MRLSAFIAVALLCCGCNRETSLGNGYKLTFIESVPADQYLIVDSRNTCVVPENVTKIAVHKQFIVGFLDRSKPLPGMSYHEPMNVAPGFFVLDTQAKKTESGLTEAEFHLRMRQLGIGSPNLQWTQHR